MIVDVTVTQDDIDAGSHDCQSCPVAHAIYRKVKPGTIIEVFQFSTKLNSIETKNPIEVRDFIRQYDYNDVAAPRTFKMDIPARFLA